MDRLLKLTADAIPGGLYRMRAEDHALEYASQGFAALTGYTQEALALRHGGDFTAILHPADREAVRSDWRQQTALHPDHSYDIEYRIVSEDGAVLRVNDRGALVVDAQTGARYLCGLLQNISDTYAAEQRLLAAQQELVEANRAKTDFLARMSHEIRTPIHAVSGLADLLLLSGELPAAPYAHALGIKSAAQTLLYLVNDILEYSKIAAGQMPIIPAPFHVQTLIEELCTQAGLRARGKEIVLLTDVDPALPQALIGDELRIKQVLLNLLTNAIKFTERGHVKLSMALRMEGQQAWVDYAVEDTGVGIRAEDVDKLFEQFQQLDPVQDRKQEGSGLGLAISRQLARLMGGDIAVRSEYGRGSRFSFALRHAVEEKSPVAAVAHADGKRLLVCVERDAVAESALDIARKLGVEALRVQAFDSALRYTHLLVAGEGAQVRAWAGAALNAGMHRAVLRGEEAGLAPQPGDLVIGLPLHAPALAAFLNNAAAREHAEMPRNEQLAQHVFATRDACALIVDDNPANLLVGSSLLKLYGLSVQEASSGRQALEMVARQRFDLVFMDHMMPEMSGEETVRALRAQPAYAALPIVILTANLPAETQEIYQGISIQGVLTKPLELARLSDMLLRLLSPEKIVPGGAAAGAGSAVRCDARALLESVALLDYAEGMLHCAGDESLYLALLFALVQDMAEKRALLEASLEAGDTATIALTVHSLKSALRSVGCAALGERALALEQLAKAGEREQLGNQLPPFVRAMEEFRLALQAQLHRLPREAQMEFTLPTF